MSKTSSDLVKEWQAERTKLQLKIARLKTEGRSLPAGEEEMTEIAMLDSLIADFSRCDTFPVAFFRDDKPTLPESATNRSTHPSTSATPRPLPRHPRPQPATPRRFGRRV
jgi:hypothetical protein